MKYLLKKKVIAVDLLLISLITFGSVFAASWIYSNILTIIGGEPTLTLTSDAGELPLVDATFILTARLTANGNPLAGKTIKFYEDNIEIGAGTTDESGYAALFWTVKSGSHDYKAGYQIV